MEQEIKIRRVDFYPADWLEGTISLTHEERSVYITICAAIYAHGGPVELKHVRKFCPGHGFKRAFDGLVDKSKVFVIRTENGLKVDQKRTQSELKRARDRTQNGLRNGLNQARSKASARADHKKHSRTINHHTSEEGAKAHSSSEGRAYAPAGTPATARPASNEEETETPASLDEWRALKATLGIREPPPPPPVDPRAEFLLEHDPDLRFDYYMALSNGDPATQQEMLDRVDSMMREAAE